MISIIVSSYKENYYQQFAKSIKETIGDISYEIIKIDNPSMMGLCKAYNQGALRAKYKYLVFAHEDILFHTANWGSIIQNVFEQDPQIGLLGCAGGMYKSLLYQGWGVDSNYTSSYMIGSHYGFSHLSKTLRGISRGIKLDINQNIPANFRETAIVNEQVIMLDGMFLVTTKNIHEVIPFDENTFKGYHCYDLDYSLQIDRQYKVVVNHNILVEHLSPGNFNLDWLNEVKNFNYKWRKVLPYSLNKLTNSQKRLLEFLSFENMLRVYKHNSLPIQNAFMPIFQISYVKKIGFANWFLLLSKILKKSVLLLFNLKLQKPRDMVFQD